MASRRELPEEEIDKERQDSESSGAAGEQGYAKDGEVEVASEAVAGQDENANEDDRRVRQKLEENEAVAGVAVAAAAAAQEEHSSSSSSRGGSLPPKSPTGNLKDDGDNTKDDSRDSSPSSGVHMGNNEWVSAESFVRGVVQQYIALNPQQPEPVTGSSEGNGSRNDSGSGNGSNSNSAAKGSSRSSTGGGSGGSGEGDGEVAEGAARLPSAVSGPSADSGSKKIVIRHKNKYNPKADLKPPPNESKQDRRRRMNRITGRRKRAKVVIEIDGLIEQCHEYTGTNQKLKDENFQLKKRIEAVKQFLKDKKEGKTPPGALPLGMHIPLGSQPGQGVAGEQQSAQPRGLLSGPNPLVPGGAQPQVPPIQPQLQQQQIMQPHISGIVPNMVPQASMAQGQPQQPQLQVIPNQLQLQQGMNQAIQAMAAASSAPQSQAQIQAAAANALIPLISFLSQAFSAATTGGTLPAAPPQQGILAGVPGQIMSPVAAQAPTNMNPQPFQSTMLPQQQAQATTQQQLHAHSLQPTQHPTQQTSQQELSQQQQQQPYQYQSQMPPQQQQQQQAFPQQPQLFSQYQIPSQMPQQQQQQQQQQSLPGQQTSPFQQQSQAPQQSAFFLSQSQQAQQAHQFPSQQQQNQSVLQQWQQQQPLSQSQQPMQTGHQQQQQPAPPPPQHPPTEQQQQMMMNFLQLFQQQQQQQQGNQQQQQPPPPPPPPNPN